MARFDLNLLSALDVLLEERNVTKAAERLNVTQPTMSGMLLRLRQQFEDHLLVRVGRQLELTPVGQSLVEPVREALFTVQALMNTGPRFDPKTNARTFTILASDYCVLVFISRVIRRLAIEAPFIRLELKPLTAPFEQLIEGKADLMVSPDDLSLYNRDPHADILNSEILFSDDFVCVVAKDHPILTNINLERFLEYPHAAVQYPGNIVTVEEVAFRNECPGYRPMYTVSDFMAIPYLAHGTSIIGIVQRRLTEMVTANHGLCTFTPPIKMPSIQEKLLWHMRHADDPAHIWLRDLLVEEGSAMHSEGDDDQRWLLATLASGLPVSRC